MKLPEGYTRISKRMIPSYPCRCGTLDCVYNGWEVAPGVCKNPEIHKGNGDAACHLEGNRSLLLRLEPLEKE